MVFLETAQRKAQRILEILQPACTQIMIAGSIRRQKSEINDIEVVAIPKFLQEDFFGEPNWSGGTSLGNLLAQLVRKKALQWDTQVPRNGDRYKRFIVESIKVPLDIFMSDSHNYGNICVIRTGDADFSRLVVTAVTLGGLLPPGMSHKDGYLWRGDERISCANEVEFFHHLGIVQEHIPHPTTRNANIIAFLRSVQQY